MPQKKIVPRALLLRRRYAYQRLFNIGICGSVFIFFAWCFSRHAHTLKQTHTLVLQHEKITHQQQLLTQEIAALEQRKARLVSDVAYLEKVARNELYLSLTSDLLFSLK